MSRWKTIEEWMLLLGYEWVKPQDIRGVYSWTEAVALMNEWEREGIVRRVERVEERSVV